jgi:uncharacterized protein (DUF1778 family)
MSKDTHIGFRAPADSRDAWQQAAEREGMSLSAWIVAACNDKISRTKRGKEKKTND